MKHLTTILLAIAFLIPIGVQGQLRGKYHRWDEWTSESITFLPRHRFVYEWSGESTDEKGAGKYVLQGDMLLLNFGHDPEPLVDPSFVVHQSPVKGTTCVLDIQTFEARDSTSIPAVAVIVHDGKKALKGMYTDDDGRCQFSVPADSDSLWIEFKYAGYHSLSIALKPRSNYEIAAYLGNRAFTNLKPGERKMYYFTQPLRKDVLYLSTYRGGEGIRYERQRPLIIR